MTRGSTSIVVAALVLLLAAGARADNTDCTNNVTALLNAASITSPMFLAYSAVSNASSPYNISAFCGYAQATQNAFAALITGNGACVSFTNNTKLGEATTGCTNPLLCPFGNLAQVSTNYCPGYCLWTSQQAASYRACVVPTCMATPTCACLSTAKSCFASLTCATSTPVKANLAMIPMQEATLKCSAASSSHAVASAALVGTALAAVAMLLA